MFFSKIDTLMALVVILLSLKGYYSPNPSQNPSSSSYPSYYSGLPRYVIDISDDETNDKADEPIDHLAIASTNCENAIFSAFGGIAGLKEHIKYAIQHYTLAFPFENRFVKMYYDILLIYAIPGNYQSYNNHCHEWGGYEKGYCINLLSNMFGSEEKPHHILYNAIYSITSSLVESYNKIYATLYFATILESVNVNLNPNPGEVMPYKHPYEFCKSIISLYSPMRQPERRTSDLSAVLECERQIHAVFKVNEEVRDHIIIAINNFTEETPLDTYTKKYYDSFYKYADSGKLKSTVDFCNDYQIQYQADCAYGLELIFGFEEPNIALYNAIYVVTRAMVIAANNYFVTTYFDEIIRLLEVNYAPENLDPYKPPYAFCQAVVQEQYGTIID